MPDPLGLDTNVDSSRGVHESDALSSNPVFDANAQSPFAGLQMPVATPEQFQQATQNQQMTWNTQTSSADEGGVRNDVVNYAKQFVGKTPYKWGGTTPNGFDCSGLVQYVTNRFGLNLPRLSYAQAGSGKRVSLNDLQAGDLVAFDYEGYGADHIALYIGNGEILEAAHTGTNVRIRKLGKNEKFWGVHLTYPGEAAASQHRYSARPI